MPGLTVLVQAAGFEAPYMGEGLHLTAELPGQGGSGRCQAGHGVVPFDKVTMGVGWGVVRRWDLG